MTCASRYVANYRHAWPDRSRARARARAALSSSADVIAEFANYICINSEPPGQFGLINVINGGALIQRIFPRLPRTCRAARRRVFRNSAK
jgi:hypothetical protein